MMTLGLILLGAILSALVVILTVGLQESARHEAEVSEEFPVAMQRLYAAVADVEAYPKWRADVRKVEIIEPSAQADRGKVMFIEVGRRRAKTFVVDDEVAPGHGPNGLAKRVHRMVTSPGKSQFTGRWIFGFEPRGKHVAVIIIEQSEISNPMVRGAARLFYSPTKSMTQFLIDLRAHVAEKA
jgi:hypothetical protein